MQTEMEILPVVPFDEGAKAGAQTGAAKARAEIESLLKGPHFKDGLAAMSRKGLTGYVMNRLQTEPDYVRFPELEDIYPERLDYLRGFAKGANATLEEAATLDYLRYRHDIESWYRSLQVPEPKGCEVLKNTGCSGILLVGPDGVIGAHVGDSLPLDPRPKGYRHRTPRPHGEWMAKKPTAPAKLVLRKPRTGYIEQWGVGNEKGVACFAGTSCSTLLDEPIEDTWPINGFPLLRFARDLDHLVDLYQRYTLYVWGRGNQIWADVSGNGAMVEKSFRRIGVQKLDGHRALWCTEGHRETPEMASFMLEHRLEYLRRAGKHRGAEDMQYATDCAVRYTRLAELCNEGGTYDLKHLNRIITDHAPFPRALCRHGGPDTAPYDRTVTLGCGMFNLTHNRTYGRGWVPWKRFCCQVPWSVTQYPARPK